MPNSLHAWSEALDYVERLLTPREVQNSVPWSLRAMGMSWAEPGPGTLWNAKQSMTKATVEAMKPNVVQMIKSEGPEWLGSAKYM